MPQKLSLSDYPYALIDWELEARLNYELTLERASGCLWGKLLHMIEQHGVNATVVIAK